MSKTKIVKVKLDKSLKTTACWSKIKRDALKKNISVHISFRYFDKSPCLGSRKGKVASKLQMLREVCASKTFINYSYKCIQRTDARMSPTKARFHYHYERSCKRYTRRLAFEVDNVVTEYRKVYTCDNAEQNCDCESDPATVIDDEDF
jgi:hypothetical protein